MGGMYKCAEASFWTVAEVDGAITLYHLAFFDPSPHVIGTFQFLFGSTRHDGSGFNTKDVHILDRETRWYEWGMKEAIWVRAEEPSWDIVIIPITFDNINLNHWKLGSNTLLLEEMGFTNIHEVVGQIEIG